MNVLFFLTPKNKVEYVYDYYSMRQALEKMQYHKYSAIPVLNKTNEYVGTISEGDLLWYIKENENFRRFNYRSADKVYKEFMLYAIGRNINKYHRFLYEKLRKFEGKTA